MTSPKAAERRRERALGKLFTAIAKRCRGATLLVGADERLSAEVRSRGLDVLGVDPADGLGPITGHRIRDAVGGKRFRTAVVCGFREGVRAAEGEILETAWDLIEQGGRFIVAAPNEGCDEGSRELEVDRKALTKALRGFGKPRLATDQPFRWILMYVEKPKPGRTRLNRTRVDRWRVTARHCRGKVIELGCNEGDLSRRIRDRGLEVTGVDLSEEKIRRARKEHPGIPFIACDILGLSLPAESFDTVVLAEVLEHVPENVGDAMLEKAWSLLGAGGRLVVSVPNEDCVPHPHHVRVFDRRSLRKILSAFGKPRLITDQPYKWLLMIVSKAIPGGRGRTV